jgi:hypothetical protein
MIGIVIVQYAIPALTPNPLKLAKLRLASRSVVVGKPACGQLNGKRALGSNQRKTSAQAFVEARLASTLSDAHMNTTRNTLPAITRRIGFSEPISAAIRPFAMAATLILLCSTP